MVISCLVIVGIAFFLFAPVIYWYNASPFVSGNFPVYHSLGCATVGFGDTYASTWFNTNSGFFEFGCQAPPAF